MKICVFSGFGRLHCGNRFRIFGIYLFYGFGIPIDLVFVKSVIFPLNAEIIAVNVGMSVESEQRTGDYSVGINDIENLISASVNSFSTFSEQAMRICRI